jgi:hypothetical protein
MTHFEFLPVFVGACYGDAMAYLRFEAIFLGESPGPVRDLLRAASFEDDRQRIRLFIGCGFIVM